MKKRKKPNEESTAIVVAQKNDAPVLSSEDVEAIKRYASRARSDNTRKAYEWQWKHFVKWCIAHGHVSLPAHPLTIAAYMTARADSDATVSTINIGRAAIVEVHRLNGFASPLKDLRVEETWRGIRNTLGVAPDSVAIPIMTDVLAKMIAATPETPHGARDRAMILLGFAGAFRRSSLVALNLEDISRDEHGLIVLLRRSKTDQEGRGTTIGIPFGNDVTCPVKALDAWLATSGISDGAIFRAVDRWGNITTRLTAQCVALAVKKAVARIGRSTKDYSGHSLRAGFATSAARAGKSTHAIKRQGTWKSTQTLDRYIREVEIFQQNAAEGLL